MRITTRLKNTLFRKVTITLIIHIRFRTNLVTTSIRLTKMIVISRVLITSITKSETSG